ncbi:Hypothetical predicted protein [Pelobates cultripes]|uniref:Uncharacterized protein n=1 Tax=Pelobates cultripes TaxID=61616 RepID=A0AAD1VQM0_PELCU|nr:Hypothetical predicted protein [Pelobates cultripes]
MADSCAAHLEQHNTSDWAATFRGKFDDVCRRFWEQLEEKRRLPALAPAKLAAPQPAPPHSQLCHPDAPTTPRKQAKTGKRLGGDLTHHKVASTSYNMCGPNQLQQASSTEGSASRQRRGHPAGPKQRLTRHSGEHLTDPLQPRQGTQDATEQP